jgi:3-oxoacyl-[acyl-carrier protein] reductase
MMKLKDKVALITGAGKSLGLAYAERFLAEGAKVVFADISAAKGQSALADLAGRGEVRFLETDITDPTSTEACARQTVEEFGRIDILINNAAISADLEFGNTSYAYLKKLFEVNLFGTFLMTQAVAAHMANRRYGRIINISTEVMYLHSGISVAPEPPPPPTAVFPGFLGQGMTWTLAAYSWSKNGLGHLTKISAIALGPWGINVNLLAPGPTASDGFIRNMGMEKLESIALSSPTKRVTMPSDQAAAALFLASDEAGAITGQTICVSGGRTMPT